MSQYDESLFRAELSSRYHRRRATFLERSALMMTLLTLIGGGSGVISLFGDGKIIAQVSAGIVTLVGLIQIVYRPEMAAMQHKAWLRRWNKVIIEIKFESTSPHDKALEVQWAREAANIESECVGEMRALQADCYNRAVRYMNIDAGNNYELRWYHRALCQIVSFEHGFEARA